MNTYLLLKNSHIVLALVSGIGFGLRGYVRVILDRPLAHPVLRVGPHLVDTLLLVSGVSLWIMTGYSVLSWLGLKIFLILAYIGFGIGAFRSRSRGTAVMLYLLTLVTFIGIALVALHKPF